MDAAKLGPITQQMYGEEGPPPAFISEWLAKLEKPGDFICLWTGVFKGREGNLGWGCLSTHFGSGAEAGTAVTDIPAAGVEALLAPLAHESRVRVMQALVDRSLTAAELTEATGFQGGRLYHHIKELQHADYVAQKDGRYGLTKLGRQLLVTVLCIANEVIQDRGERGLAVGARWAQ